MATHLPSQERLYAIISPELFETKVVHKQDQATCGFFAELREISCQHARILAPGPLRLQEKCQISISSSRLKGPLAFTAEVEWARPNPAGDWLLGCNFLPAIEVETFLELLESGLLERRSAPRQQIRLEVQVQWRPDGELAAGRVCDMSAGGLCLLSSKCPEETRHFSIRGQNPSSVIHLKAQWWIAVGANYFIGCEFVRASDVTILREIQADSIQEENAHYRAQVCC